MNHDDDCLCFPCYGIRLRKTNNLFVTLQGFNNTIPDPMINLPDFAEILLQKELDKEFTVLMNGFWQPSLQ